MNMAHLLETFREEAAELLQQMETILLRFDSGTADEEDLHALFRTAHTLKGSAGLFGYSVVVEFTHVVENVLDLLRGGKLEFSAALTELLLQCHQHIEHVLEATMTDSLQSVDSEHQADLLARLSEYAGARHASPAAADPVPAAKVAPAGEGAGHWHLSLRFNDYLFQTGLDPLSMLRYLRDCGQILHVDPLTETLPEFQVLDPRNCHFGFEVAFESEISRKEIEEIFEFVWTDGDIRIIEPHAPLSAFADLLAGRPNELDSLPERLVRCGTLTPALVDILRSSANAEEEVSTVSAVEPEIDSVEATRPVAASMVHAPATPQLSGEPTQAKAANGDDKHKAESRAIKISAERLDRLIDLVGELVIAGAGTHLKASHLQQPDLLENVAQLQSLVEEVRDTALSLRMVQVGEVFSRFPRVVRDLSKELGKNIDLTMSGHETELDKAMVDKIVEPLMHIVRNAIDHGIEMPADREAAGKNPHGTLHLSAYHQSGGIVIELSDDGRGLDKNRIYAKAVEKGLISAEAQLSEQDIFNLVLLPGFSTADRVTNLSGRGVGMDVVRSSVEALRGTLHIESSPGQGTHVRMCLPLTLAIIDAFQIGVGSSTFVLPLEMVSECVELPSGVGERQYVNLRGNVLPFIRLSKFLNIRDELKPRRNIVVVKHGNKQAGIEVDNLFGECQAVIKPLGELFRHVRGISGTTILGSGDVALILDIPQLIEQAEQQHIEQQVH